MEKLTEILHASGASCVVENRGEVRQFYQRGVKDLYCLYKTESSFLCGAKVADKVVGRAAATLMILGGVESIYAQTISTLALQTLSNTDIKVIFEKEVPYIINRTKTDLCPLERATKHLSSTDDIFAAIEQFILSMA